MRWLADENLPLAAIVFLRACGGDVLEVAESAPGVADQEVLRLARDTDRLLLSFDRDHGELIFRRAARAPLGVGYLRLEPPLPEVLNALLYAVLAMGEAALLGKFTVVTQHGTRQRALPID